MTESRYPQALAAVAAVVTTFALFSSVVSIADEDKGTLAASHVKPTAVAQATNRVQR